jgi:uncharacterized repeat protein (TIGR04076 family)
MLAAIREERCMRIIDFQGRVKLMRAKPTAIVHAGYGTGCPAGYRTGERIPLNMANPSGSFKCEGAFDALEPFIDHVQERAEHEGDFPECQFFASCDCPISDQEMVFHLYTRPAPFVWPDEVVEVERP